MKYQYTLGCDESGTGAWAGPFTVVAFLAESASSAGLVAAGARDSKTLSFRRRENLVGALASRCLLVGLEVVPPGYSSQRVAWRVAMYRAMAHALSYFEGAMPRVRIVVDGSYDQDLTRRVKDEFDLRVEFMPKADQLVPEVSAASILAKTRRSELMREAHRAYPQYGWSSADGHGNEGYGTAAHMEAIQRYGVCALHRRVKPLLPFFDASKAAQGTPS